jgi:hypothetical protein
MTAVPCACALASTLVVLALSLGLGFILQALVGIGRRFALGVRLLPLSFTSIVFKLEPCRTYAFDVAFSLRVTLLYSIFALEPIKLTL